MENSGLDELKARIKIGGRNRNNLRYVDDTTLMESEEELKSLLMRVKEESESAGFRLKKKPKNLSSWHLAPLLHANRRVKGASSDRLPLLGLQVTVDGGCSHEIRIRLLLGRKAMTNRDSVLKSRDITLPTKDHTVKAMAFPVVVYCCESWMVKKAECW